MRILFTFQQFGLKMGVQDYGGGAGSTGKKIISEELKKDTKDPLDDYFPKNPTNTTKQEPKNSIDNKRTIPEAIYNAITNKNFGDMSGGKPLCIGGKG